MQLGLLVFSIIGLSVTCTTWEPVQGATEALMHSRLCLFALSVKALCLDGPRAHLLGYSALSTLRKARRVEARLSRFHTIAKSVVADRPLIGR